MRMLFLSLLIFMLAGVSIGVSRLGLTDFTPDFLARPAPALSFEFTPEPALNPSEIAVYRARPTGVMMLTSAARAQTARFQMPQDVAITSGVLELNATVQIADNEHSLLRVLVGNQARGEILLRPGQHELQTEVELTSDDLASDSLAIRYVLIPPDDVGACTASSGWSNVVEVEQTSRVILEVADANLTPRDQVAAWGNVVLIGWPDWLSEEMRQERWLSAAKLAKRGYQIRFVDAADTDTLSGKPLQALVDSDIPARVIEDVAPAWPEYLAQVGANAGKQIFQRTTSWRHWYRIGPHDHLSAPGAFEYEMFLSSLPGGADWTVTVTHNESIIDVQELPGNIGLLSGYVNLLDEEILDSNVIEVTATSGYEPDGLCNDGPDLFGELRPDTRLIAGGEVFEDSLIDVKYRLNQWQPVTVSFPEAMSLIEAQRMLDLTIELMTDETEIRIGDEDATLIAVRRVDIADVVPTLPVSAFVVFLDENKRAIATGPTAFINDKLNHTAGALVMIVDPDQTNRSSRLEDQ